MYQVYEVEESASNEEKEEMGGNNPTHLNSILGIFLPDVVNVTFQVTVSAFLIQYEGSLRR